MKRFLIVLWIKFFVARPMRIDRKNLTIYNVGGMAV